MRNVMRGLGCGLLYTLAGAAYAADSGTSSDGTGYVDGDGAPPLSSTISLPSSFQLTCDWLPANGTPTADGQNNIRYGYIELAAGYYQFFLSPSFPVGTQFRIDGQYPKARNFSLQLYNGPKGGLAYLPDYKVQPDPGSQSPFTGINTVDRAIAGGGHYTIHIIYGTAPAVVPANTVYVDAKQFSAGSQAVFVYRVYNAYSPYTVAEHGGVPLPPVYEQTAQGDVSLTSLNKPAICNAGIEQRNARRVVRAQLSDQLNAKPERPNPIPAQPVPAAPQFMLRDNPKDVLANSDNRYIYAQLSQTLGDLVLMRAKAPTFATGPGSGSDPQLRHWSVCQNAYITVETYQCIEDTDMVLDSDGFFNVVISVQAKKPANADSAHKFNWLTYGTDREAAPILRHMLASPNFTQSAFAVPSGDAANAPAIMGDYFPVSTYCAASVFQAHTAAGETPKQVFADCAAGK
jgi:hypothetical protein